MAARAPRSRQPDCTSGRGRRTRRVYAIVLICPGNDLLRQCHLGRARREIGEEAAPEKLFARLGEPCRRVAAAVAGHHGVESGLIGRDDVARELVVDEAEGLRGWGVRALQRLVGALHDARHRHPVDVAGAALHLEEDPQALLVERTVGVVAADGEVRPLLGRDPEPVHVGIEHVVVRAVLDGGDAAPVRELLPAGELAVDGQRVAHRPGIAGLRQELLVGGPVRLGDLVDPRVEPAHRLAHHEEDVHLACERGEAGDDELGRQVGALEGEGDHVVARHQPLHDVVHSVIVFGEQLAVPHAALGVARIGDAEALERILVVDAEMLDRLGPGLLHADMAVEFAAHAYLFFSGPATALAGRGDDLPGLHAPVAGDLSRNDRLPQAPSATCAISGAVLRSQEPPRRLKRLGRQSNAPCPEVRHVRISQTQKSLVVR